MTQRAMEIIKELAELNDKVLNLETELKQELCGNNRVTTVTNTWEDCKKETLEESEEEKRQNRIKTCISFEEPIAGEDKRYFKDLEMPKNEFLNTLYKYGYHAIEDLFWNWKSKITTYNEINFAALREKIGRHTLHDWWILYHCIKSNSKADIFHEDDLNIDFDADPDVDYFNLSIDRFTDELSLATRNTLKRAGVECIADYMLIKDIKKFKKEARGYGPKAQKEMAELMSKIIEGEY